MVFQLNYCLKNNSVLSKNNGANNMFQLSYMVMIAVSNKMFTYKSQKYMLIQNSFDSGKTKNTHTNLSTTNSHRPPSLTPCQKGSA